MKLVSMRNKVTGSIVRVPRATAEREIRDAPKIFTYSSKNAWRRVTKEGKKRAEAALYGRRAPRKATTRRVETAPYSWKKGKRPKKAAPSIGRGAMAALVAFACGLFGKGGNR